MRNLSINSKHMLEGDQVTPEIVLKTKSKFKDGDLDTIIIHYTAGGSARTSVDFLKKEGVQASAHLVIGRQGEIFQLVPFDTIAWHAGKSHYGNRTGYNKYSIGIELENAGWLEKSGTEYIAWFGGRYLANDVIQATHRNENSPRYWHTYTPQQIEACRHVCELLLKDKRFKINTILGHEEISPGRKLDPGPAFPLDQFRNNLLFHDRSDVSSATQLQAKVVNTDFLNIREQAGVEYKKVAQPLKRNQEVIIKDELGGWFLVETKIEGWVSKGYIEKK